MNNPIFNLTIEELITQFKAELLTKEFVVLDMDKNDYALEFNTPLKDDFFSMILIEKGSFTYKVRDQRSTIESNSLLFCPKLETYTIESISDDYKAKAIFFTAEFITQAGFNYRSNDILKSFSNTPVIVVNGEKELLKKISFYLEQLQVLNSTLENNYYFNELIWHSFSVLIYEMDNYFKKIEVTHPVSPRAEDITTKFFLLLQENYKEHHDVQFYADRLFVTRKYLSKVIKKTMFKSTREIINHLLINEAKILLRNYNISVSHTADQLKFSDQSVFSKFFKKHTGLTPSEYKKDDLF